MIKFSFLANEIVKIVYILPFMSKLREIYFDTRTNGSQARRKKSRLLMSCWRQDSLEEVYSCQQVDFLYIYSVKMNC